MGILDNVPKRKIYWLKKRIDEGRYYHKSSGDGCWVSLVSHNGLRYSQIKINGKEYYLHRVIYEIFKGSIPFEMQLDHLCRNRKCCNPNHLEPVSISENTKRSYEARR
jgi:hypothetical protein